MYHPNTHSLITKFEADCKHNERLLSDHAKELIKGIENLIDIQHEIASNFVGLWLSDFTGIRKGHKEVMPLLFLLFHRNFFLFYSALKLTISGLHIPARPLLRNIFESVMIAKFCHISDDVNVMTKWDLGESVYFTNAILKKIVKPDPKPFFEFWATICKYSHATKTAAQLSLTLKEADNIENVVVNLALIKALLECNYHLLTAHLITPELNYPVKFYTTRVEPKIRDYRIPQLREAARNQFRKNREYLGPESVKLITAYKRKWEIKK